MAMASNSDDLAAHSVAVQLPTFNRLAPTAWFNLANANFHLRGISKSDAKYWYVVSKLNQDTLQKLSAFLARKRGEDPYVEIQEVLCKTYEPKLEQKLDALLACSDIGDERPAEYALELRWLLDNATVDDILKRLFIRSLPKPLFNTISGCQDDSLDSLVEAANKAWALAATQSQTNAITPAPNPTRTAAEEDGNEVPGRQGRTAERWSCVPSTWSGGTERDDACQLVPVGILGPSNSSRCFRSRRSDRMIKRPRETSRSVAERGRDSSTRKSRISYRQHLRMPLLTRFGITDLPLASFKPTSGPTTSVWSLQTAHPSKPMALWDEK